MYKLILSILILSSIALSGTRHKAGGTLNNISGSGILYSYRIDKFWYWETSGFVYFEGVDPSKELETHLMIGTEIQRSFYHIDQNRLYAFAGFSHWYIDRAITETIMGPVREEEITKHDINRIYNFGIGAGWEYQFRENFYFSVSAGLQYQLSEPFRIGELIDRNPEGTNFLGPGFGLSLKYAF